MGSCGVRGDSSDGSGMGMSSNLWLSKLRSLRRRRAKADAGSSGIGREPKVVISQDVISQDVNARFGGEVGSDGIKDSSLGRHSDLWEAPRSRFPLEPASTGTGAPTTEAPAGEESLPRSEATTLGLGSN